jgi:threonine dehydratase
MRGERMNDLPVTIAAIRWAAAAIHGTIAHTPTVPAGAISELVGAKIHLKLETLHRTGSFKERGALARLLTLSPSERRAGVVAMSAGNHAQGVAYHARRLGVPATIVMPEGTPFIKIDRTEAYGAKVLLKGDSLVAAREAADALATRGWFASTPMTIQWSSRVKAPSRSSSSPTSRI